MHDEELNDRNAREIAGIVDRYESMVASNTSTFFDVVELEALIEHYLGQREPLAGVVLIMDARRPLTDFDRQLLEWGGAYGLAFHLVLTKADKLKQQAKQKALREGRELAAQFDGDIQVELFSSLKGTGKDKMVNIVRGHVLYKVLV